jgi:hypothetical protein
MDQIPSMRCGSQWPVRHILTCQTIGAITSRRVRRHSVDRLRIPWRALISTDRSCNAGCSDHASGSIPRYEMEGAFVHREDEQDAAGWEVLGNSTSDSWPHMGGVRTDVAEGPVYILDLNARCCIGCWRRRSPSPRRERAGGRVAYVYMSRSRTVVSASGQVFGRGFSESSRDANQRLKMQ